MSYKVKLTPHAIGQLKETIGYISKQLLVPDVALAWSNRLQKEISGLDTLPLRYPLVENEPWKSYGIRKMPVENFIVYYLPEEETETVWVTAVVYGRRDQQNALKDMPIK
ncbi:MAG: type II toxin-antitoxin system RelE/ParE family toxin [Firmicutes bacterium]|nr:type II toxin-antitoxin system RelE/ParE family toxin [Candidatus Colimorpha enterica]